jgi:hypothetical protein
VELRPNHYGNDGPSQKHMYVYKYFSI